MRTESVNIYKFAELSEEAQQKALENLSTVNVDYDWWDSEYGDFKELCKTIGIDVDLKKTYFRGFYSQGDGSSFAADVSVPTLLRNIQEQKWKEYAPQLELNFGKLDVDSRVLKLIESGIIDVYVKVVNANRETAVALEYDTTYNWGECQNYNRIEAELDKLESYLDDVMETMNAHLFTTLRNQYDYLTGEEAIKETIEANEYEFYESGDRY